MGFDTRQSIVKELEYAKESGDKEYVNQCRYEIAAWDADGFFDPRDFFTKSELTQRRNGNTLEEEGAAFLFCKFMVNYGFEDSIMDVYCNISGQRDIGRFDIHDEYKIGDAKETRIGGCVINGNCVYAEVWYDDAPVLYIAVN